jgi:hypothetical protein
MICQICASAPVIRPLVVKVSSNIAASLGSSRHAASKATAANTSSKAFPSARTSAGPASTPQRVTHNGPMAQTFWKTQSTINSDGGSQRGSRTRLEESEPENGKGGRDRISNSLSQFYFGDDYEERFVSKN